MPASILPHAQLAGRRVHCQQALPQLRSSRQGLVRFPAYPRSPRPDHVCLILAEAGARRLTEFLCSPISPACLLSGIPCSLVCPVLPTGAACNHKQLDLHRHCHSPSLSRVSLSWQRHMHCRQLPQRRWQRRRLSSLQLPQAQPSCRNSTLRSWAQHRQRLKMLLRRFRCVRPASRPAVELSSLVWKEAQTGCTLTQVLAAGLQ